MDSIGTISPALELELEGSIAALGQSEYGQITEWRIQKSADASDEASLEGCSCGCGCYVRTL